MVSSSTLIPPSIESKSSSFSPRKDSNASSSGAYSAEFSRCSYGYDETSADSLDVLPSAHYIIKCNLTRTSSATPTPSPPSSVLLTPRVQVTIEQSSTESLKTPSSPNLPIQTPQFIMTNTSMASSAPEFSLSGTSSLDDSDELALYEQYLSISHGRQSNPSPEIRKKLFDDQSALQIKVLPRSKSEVHTIPIEQIQQQQASSTSKTLDIKPVMNIDQLFVHFSIDNIYQSITYVNFLGDLASVFFTCVYTHTHILPIRVFFSLTYARFSSNRPPPSVFNSLRRKNDTKAEREKEHSAAAATTHGSCSVFFCMRTRPAF